MLLSAHPRSCILAHLLCRVTASFEMVNRTIRNRLALHPIFCCFTTSFSLILITLGLDFLIIVTVILLSFSIFSEPANTHAGAKCSKGLDNFYKNRKIINKWETKLKSDYHLLSIFYMLNTLNLVLLSFKKTPQEKYCLH